MFGPKQQMHFSLSLLTILTSHNLKNNYSQKHKTYEIPSLQLQRIQILSSPPYINTSTMSNPQAAFPTYTASTFFGQNDNYNDLLASQQFQQVTSEPQPSAVSSSSQSSSVIVPTASTVVIGKGSVPKKAPGNRKLRALVQAKVNDYVNARSKMVKSSIVTDIYFFIEESCLKEGNSPPFVRYDKDGYTRSSESIAREKITSTFRDCLHDKYKSSSKNKVAKRRLQNKRKAEKKRETLRMAQQQQLDVLQNELLKIRQADECTSSFSPALVQSCNYGLQQTEKPQQQQQFSNMRSNSSFNNLYTKLFTANSLHRISSIGTFSKPLIEFDRSFVDIDLEPVPIAESLEYSSTSSSSSCSSQSCFNSGTQV